MVYILKGSGNGCQGESGSSEIFSFTNAKLLCLGELDVIGVLSVATASPSVAMGASANKEMLLIIS